MIFPQPKHPPARAEKYKAFVREQVCAAWGLDCGGSTECAHLGTTGRGMKASDYLTVPLCTRHHAESHNVGIITFQLNREINLWEACSKLQAKWMDQR